MVKTILYAAAALLLASGAGFAQSTTYSKSTTETMPSGPGVSVEKHERRTTEGIGGGTVEKEKSVTKDADGNVTSKTRIDTDTSR